MDFKLDWDEHPDGEGFYAFPNDAGDSLYVIDLLDSGKYRLFIGGELVQTDEWRTRKFCHPSEAMQVAQEDLEGRLRRLSIFPSP